MLIEAEYQKKYRESLEGLTKEQLVKICIRLNNTCKKLFEKIAKGE